jgi:protein-S-isoprenylcysteine O-methyltransferase Ste14
MAGAVLGLLGMGLAIRSALLLGGRGRPRRGPQPAFVIAGPYVRMRNPLFAGALLAAFGVAMWYGSTAGLFAAALVAVATHAWVVGVEETRLRRRFGAAYDEYVRRVPRWIPIRRGGMEE